MMFTMKSSARLLPVATLLLTTACSTVNETAIRPTPQDLPQTRIHSYDPPNQCMQRFIRATLDARDEKVLFLMDGLPDLIKNSRDWTSGPLTAAGGVMLADQLSRYGGQRVVLQGVPSAEVRNYVQLGQEFGLAEITKLQRQYGVNRIFLIDGGFVGHDQARTSGGRAGSAQYRNDKTEIQAETGIAGESGRIDFILKVTDVMTNRLLATIALSSTERRRAASTKFTLEVNGVGGGYASQNVEVDGTHNVQASIIAAAHFYLWQMILPGNDEAACLYDPATSPSVFARSLSAYEAATQAGKVRLLQTALNDVLGASQPKLKVDGLMGAQTLAGVRAAERRLGLAPSARSDFATLYASLVKARNRP